jgi:serine/threonine protein phosphatase PrpC
LDVPLEAGDAFLLASDGFWEWVEESEMELDLAGARCPGNWLDRMEDRLRARVPADNDNYSAIAVWVTNGDAFPTPKVVV